jgi:flagellar basal body-associated protein FliL
MAFCYKCGEELTNEHNFCPKCGAKKIIEENKKVENTPNDVKKASTKEIIKEEGNNSTHVNEPEKKQNEIIKETIEDKKPKKKKLKIILLIVIPIVIIGGSIGGYFWYIDNKRSQRYREEVKEITDLCEKLKILDSEAKDHIAKGNYNQAERNYKEIEKKIYSKEKDMLISFCYEYNNYLYNAISFYKEQELKKYLSSNDFVDFEKKLVSIENKMKDSPHGYQIDNILNEIMELTDEWLRNNSYLDYPQFYVCFSLTDDNYGIDVFFGPREILNSNYYGSSDSDYHLNSGWHGPGKIAINNHGEYNSICLYADYGSYYKADLGYGHFSGSINGENVKHWKHQISNQTITFERE